MANNKFGDIKEAYLGRNRKAIAGRILLYRYVGGNDIETLSWLLRHHREGNILDEETWLRDDVDYLLEYFSVLGLALSTGYLTQDDLKGERAEIIFLLRSRPVERYYSRHYKIHFPQILWRAIEAGIEFERMEAPEVVEREFMTFHSLNQAIDNDDVNQFLWFLDGGWNDDSNVDELRNVLRDVPKAIRMAKSKSKNALNQSVRGFFEYLEFLNDFEEFIGTVEGSFARSAYWYYHNYWFRRISKYLRTVIEDWHYGMQRYSESKAVATDGQLEDDFNTSLSAYGELLDKVVNNRELEEIFESGIKEKIRGVF